MKGMSEALTAMRKAARRCAPGDLLCFQAIRIRRGWHYSAGWASFLQAVVDAGLAVDGTWPVRTELANRMIGQGRERPCIVNCSRLPQTRSPTRESSHVPNSFAR